VARSHTDMALRAQIGTKIKPILNEKKLNQTAAAKEIGIHRTAFNRALNGKATPSSEILAKICDVFGVTFEIGGKEFGARDFRPRKAARTPELSKNYVLPFDSSIQLSAGTEILEVTATRRKAADEVEFRIVVKRAS
jgi:transcriptional regulator with XRE-family HTH domain